MAAREAYSLYVERAVEGANEADGPLSSLWGGQMVARIGTWQGSGEELDRWIDRSREQVKPTIAEDPGLVSAYWLVDRSAGKGLIVTLWESEAAMRASEQARLKRQAAMTTSTGAVVTTDRYEVIDSLTMM